MRDLNNLMYFAKIVEYGSLSAAGNALGVSKSVLSQHLAKLESELGVRLIQRSTRKLQVTELGLRYYDQCVDVLRQIELADRVIDEARSTPRGLVRMTSPINFSQMFLAPLLSKFLLENPEIEVLLDITNREIDLIAEDFDLALNISPRVRTSSQIVRSFPLPRHLLVASKSFVAEHGLPKVPEDLRGLPCVGGIQGISGGGREIWELVNTKGEVRNIVHRPRLLTEDLFVLKSAALAGCGIAELPPVSCRGELMDGSLVHLLPGWNLPEMHLNAVFSTREGLPNAVRKFIDYLSDRLDKTLDDSSLGTMRLSMVPLSQVRASSGSKVAL
ncbi:MAG TPA: LysR substrate-binding domain-containing protein [Dokdonella sp.]|uniref:LysR substrate-binding domain-containing protein n=1 Tax=Dokdonella sp. TaxID=2291710 RepID=UPI002D804339|nr:LysR substrate-binding domain-containing protein [Dokdonella sp.]HET9033896.1 LysR substrate-binding domain-containing protein [Dokdonella sp.]